MSYAMNSERRVEVALRQEVTTYVLARPDISVEKESNGHD